MELWKYQYTQKSVQLLVKIMNILAGKGMLIVDMNQYRNSHICDNVMEQ